MFVEGGGVFVPDAEAAHAGVDLKVDVEFAVGGAGDGIEAFHFLGGGDGHGDIVVEHVAGFVGEQRAEQQDGPARAEFTQGGGFGEVGHGEEIGSCVHETRGGLVKAVAVGVGFDDRDVTHVAGQRGADEAQVALEDREIDLGPATKRQT